MRWVVLCAVILAVAGCAQTAAPAGSEQACVQFGVTALENHVTITTVPPACRGLSGADINDAVARALSIAARGAHGKAASRARAASLSPLLARLIQAQSAQAASPAPAAVTSIAAPSDRETLGVPALAVWLLTLGLGTAMVRRWIFRLLGRGPLSGRALGRLPPAAIVAHAGLALAGLLAWGIYLIGGWAGAGWSACAVLLVVISLGVALISLWLPERGQASHPPAALVVAHGVVAVTTITLVLAALGTG
jgi:manganese efflux pump family protein